MWVYEVFCGIVYVLKTGCQWRMLLIDFPKWQTVYSYFQTWSQQRAKGEMSIFEMALKKVKELRVKEGKEKNQVHA